MGTESLRGTTVNRRGVSQTQSIFHDDSSDFHSYFKGLTGMVEPISRHKRDVTN